MTAAIALMGSLQHNIPGLKLWIVKSFVIFLPIIYNNALFSYVKSRTQTCPLSSSPILSHADEYFSPYYIETWRHQWTRLSLILVSGLTSLWWQAIRWIDTVSLLPGPLWIMETQTDTETSHWRRLPTPCECFSSRFQCIKTVLKPCADNGNFVLIVLLCCLRWILCRFNPSLTR